MISPRFRRLTLGLLVLLVSSRVALSAAEIPDAAQPQLAVTPDGRVFLTYGYRDDVFVAQSADGGATFSAGMRVATIPKLMLGMRRGPRIAAQGNRVTITANGAELFAFHSVDGARSWQGPVTVNEVPTSAREGLHDLAVSSDGRTFVTWLDLRNGKTELWGAQSIDGGRTWGPNAPVYRSPDKSICECCHPTAKFDSMGNLAVMWRNSIEGSRDMWLATRERDAATFGPAQKLGEGTWKLNACPMDGGTVIDLGNGKFGAVWQRAGEVFFSPAAGAEIGLGKGKQPVVVLRNGQLIAVWQQGPDLVSMPVAGTTAPVKRASDARFCVLVALPKNRGALLAYEHGPLKNPAVIVERY